MEKETLEDVFRRFLRHHQLTGVWETWIESNGVSLSELTPEVTDCGWHGKVVEETPTLDKLKTEIEGNIKAYHPESDFGKGYKQCMEDVNLFLEDAKLSPPIKEQPITEAEIEKMADEYCKEFLPGVDTTGHWLGFQEGYKKAQEKAVDKGGEEEKR